MAPPGFAVQIGRAGAARDSAVAWGEVPEPAKEVKEKGWGVLRRAAHRLKKRVVGWFW